MVAAFSLRDTSTRVEYMTRGASEVGAAKKGAAFAHVFKGWGGSQSHRRWKPLFF